MTETKEKENKSYKWMTLFILALIYGLSKTSKKHEKEIAELKKVIKELQSKGE